MKVAVVASNMIRIHRNVRKGTEIFVYLFLKNLTRHIRSEHLPIHITAFASGDSDLPVPIQSISRMSSQEDPSFGISHHKLMEMSLFSKAFSKQRFFDLYHVHVSNGEWVLPFTRFTTKPVLITMHGQIHPYDASYFSHFQDLKNVFFVSISNSQRKLIPHVQYAATIYHGVDVNRMFTFNESGGSSIIWAGRTVPEKGLDTVLKITHETGHHTSVFPILTNEYVGWLKRDILGKASKLRKKDQLTMEFNMNRSELVQKYQHSKLFLFPMRWEEPFGLVIIESLACGTPVVAYARGSAPEIIDDGVTGFLVNPTDDDKRGDWIVKKTGIAGLIEAVNRIYSLSLTDYKAMRHACRDQAATKFSVNRMVSDYTDLYAKLTR